MNFTTFRKSFQRFDILISKEATANDAMARFWSRARREKKPAKRMVKGALLTLGLPDRAN